MEEQKEKQEQHQESISISDGAFSCTLSSTKEDIQTLYQWVKEIRDEWFKKDPNKNNGRDYTG